MIKKEWNVLFNDALNTFYLRLYGVRHMKKDHSDSNRGNPLPPHGLLFSISSKGYFICIITQHSITHTTAFVTPVVEQWLEREIAQWVHHEGSTRRPIAQWATTELHLAPLWLRNQWPTDGIYHRVSLFFLLFFLLFFFFFLILLVLRLLLLIIIIKSYIGAKCNICIYNLVASKRTLYHWDTVAWRCFDLVETDLKTV